MFVAGYANIGFGMNLLSKCRFKSCSCCCGGGGGVLKASSESKSSGVRHRGVLCKLRDYGGKGVDECRGEGGDLLSGGLEQQQEQKCVLLTIPVPEKERLLIDGNRNNLRKSESSSNSLCRGCWQQENMKFCSAQNNPGKICSFLLFYCLICWLRGKCAALR